MILPISLFVLVAALYAASKQETGWLVPVNDYLYSLKHVFGYSQHASTNIPQDDWNLLYHLGGNGPWIPKVDGIVQGGLSTPEGCKVEQVHMISRHNERYPTLRATHDMVALHNHLRTLPFKLQGDLSFFNNWTFFMSDDYLSKAGQLIPTGQYAGTLGAFQAGITFRTRYPNLRETAITRNQTNFWAADSPRVVDTARHFAAGFFGLDWANGTANLHIVPETRELGADTLTTGNTCAAYLNDQHNEGRDKGLRKLTEWQSIYLPPILQRLEQQNPGLNLGIAEVYTMQELCGFELLARGTSPWCTLFTPKEMEDFEYARDVLHYFRTGPGNKYSSGRGFPFLNATANLLAAGPSAGPLFLSFVHDGDILPLLSALDLFPQPQHLPTDTPSPPARTWKTSSLVPMGARVVFERVACPHVYCHSNAPLYPNHVYCDPPVHEPYVRVVVNDGVVPVPGCDGGPGRTCPLSAFERRVLLRGWEVGGFGTLCGLEDGAADKITFLHQ